MPKVYFTTLRLASGGFGEWDWIESVEVEGCKTYRDYEEWLDDFAGADLAGRWEVTEDLAGKIHNERGRVYRIDGGCDPDGNRIDSYEMVWIEEDDAA